MPTRPEDYNVGWICAVETERVVACELLDEEYTNNNEPRIDSLRDHNIYTFGRIHNHNVVIASLPQGRYGIASAARVAENLQSSFPALQLSLMVGIAGGVPSQKHDIRLGDVVVSSPIRRHCGVINYDFGKAIQEKEFEETGHLASPSNILLNATGALQAQHKREGHKISSTIANMLERNKRLRAEYSRPGIRLDKLYRSDYIHCDQEACDCQVMVESGFDSNPYLIQRPPRGRDEDNPAIHYGLIASADRLVKDAILRDALAQKHDVLCFEMEAAGLMNSDLRCLVIRGICDYADTHKNDAWQGYAAATAAAYAKELLTLISSPHPRLAATTMWMPAVQSVNYASEDITDVNVKVGPANTQKSIQHTDDINVNIVLAGMRDAFTRASQDARIGICIEIAKRSDQFKTLVHVQQIDATKNQQQDHETNQDQVFANCISRCAKRKPSEAAEALSRSFSGSADFSFERGNNFYPEQYSIGQAHLDRTVFIASKESKADKYSIELFLYYLVKRRRWQRVHVCVTAEDKFGDLAMIPISTADLYAYLDWTSPPLFAQMLESILQDLDLTGPVTRVDLPLYRHAKDTIKYDFESVQANVDYEQKDLLESIERNTIKSLQDMGCKQYQESQLTSLRRLMVGRFLVNDGSCNYVEYKAPFARSAWTVNEFESFIEEMMQFRRLSDCQGVINFIGIVLDDHRTHISGYLVEETFLPFTTAISLSQLGKFTIPQTLRRFWAVQLATGVSKIHSKGTALSSRIQMSLSQSLDLRIGFVHSGNLFARFSGGRPVKHPDTNSAQKCDVFRLGLGLWKLGENIGYSTRHICTLLGCTTRPYYRCEDVTHYDPVSLPFSHRSDPVLRGIVEKCRIEDPDKRPTAQEVCQMIVNAFDIGDMEIEISRHKKALRANIKDVLEYASIFKYCDECMTPALPYAFHCNICYGGDFDLCASCVANGVHCLDDSHQLLKLREDSLGNIIQIS